VALDMEELRDIVERARSGQLSEEDQGKLRDTIETLAWMQQELANKDVTLARMRSLFGLGSSEKTKKVLGEAAPDGNDKAAWCSRSCGCPRIRGSRTRSPA
jgi:hypothetical protein